MRTPIFGGNWKMNSDLASATARAQMIAETIAGQPALARAEIAIFPPFPYLLSVGEVLRAANSRVMLGAQNLYHADKGAFTGEVSPLMLKDVGVKIVLCGHSERRHVLHEGDDMVNAKVRSALAAGLHVILCVGEKLEQRLTGQTDTVNERQVERGLQEVSADQLSRVVIAYEPVWAIGTGKTATPADAQDAHAKIRSVVADMFGKDAAAAMRIQYGGSMTAANAGELLAQPDIDGGLIGGASLKPEDFMAIVAAMANRVA